MGHKKEKSGASVSINPPTHPPTSSHEAPEDFLDHLMYVLDSLDDVFSAERFLLTWCSATTLDEIKKVGRWVGG